jgi:hypothetical protein
MEGLDALGCTLVKLDTTDQDSIDAALQQARERARKGG